ELQRDVRHQREDAGRGDREAEEARTEPRRDEVGRRYETVPMADGPEAWHEDEDDRPHQDRVGDREPAGHRPKRVHRARDGDERVRRVQVAAEQEPGDETAEGASAEAPLVEAVQPLGAAPANRREADDGDEHKKDGKDREGDRVELHGHSPLRRRGMTTSSMYATPWQSALMKSQASEYQ